MFNRYVLNNSPRPFVLVVLILPKMKLALCLLTPCLSSVVVNQSYRAVIADNDTQACLIRFVISMNTDIVSNTHFAHNYVNRCTCEKAISTLRDNVLRDTHTRTRNASASHRKSCMRKAFGIQPVLIQYYRYFTGELT